MNAQNTALDSLLNTYSQAPHDSIKVHLLNKIAYQYHRINIDSTSHYSSLALELAKRKGFRYEEGRAYNIQGIVATFKGEYQKALELNAKSFEIAKELNHTHLTSVSSNGLCITYERLNNTQLSIYYGKIALEAAREEGEALPIAYILSNLSEFHFEEGNYAEAEVYTNEVLELAEQSNNCQLLSIGNQHLGKLKYAENNFKEAKKSFDLSLKHAKECDDEYIASLTYYWMSLIHYSDENYTKAKDYIDRSNKIFESIGGRELHLENYKSEADILIKLGKQQAAINTLLDGLSKAKKGKQLEFEAIFLSKLGSIYKETGQYNTALGYIENSKAMQDSINTFNKAISMLELERKYNMEKKEVQVELLQEQKSKDAQIIKSRSYFIMASTLFAMLIGALAFFIWLNLKKEAKYNTQLEIEVDERTKELKLSNEMLVRSNEELERFAYISSHDLKEPLKNITSFTKLIKNESLKSNLPKINEYSDILSNCSNQLNTLVSDILDYSKVKVDLKMQKVDLGMIVDQIKVDLSETLDSKKAIIKSEKLPSIISDKSKMYQAFKNLIENGIKYNESSVPMINITSEESPSSWKLMIKDNGIGIDPKHHDNIFMMFKRLHNKDEYPGSGIGLSTVKTIIEKLNGTISVDSKLNIGSQFTITLPKLSA